jgi:transcriptional regulator
MYIPGPFAENDEARIAAFVAAHPLATLAGVEDGRPVADHLPFICTDRLAPGGTMVAHTAKGNATWRQGERGAEVLLVFSGASAYVSPSFYPSKARTHEVVPTWNYSTVHVRGTLRCVHDEAEKLAIVTMLTDRMEASRPVPWKVTDAPAPYIAKMLAGIVGLRLEVQSVTAKAKASQNRTAEDRSGVVEGLAADEGNREAAGLAGELLDRSVRP